ncbi:MAG: hypothetical protein ABI867_30390 [Kofleriaceae bacterium]
MLEPLRAALAAGDWNHALVLANALWCEGRSPLMGRFVDAIATHVEPVAPPPPRRGPIHTWWLERAFAHDPRDLGALVATFALAPAAAERQRKPAAIAALWASRPHRAIVEASHQWYSERWVDERIAALLAWPDDARLAGALIDLVFADWRYSTSLQSARLIWQAANDRLVELRDRRTLPALRAIAERPRAATPALRDLQQDHARLTLARLERAPAARDPEVGPLFDACAALARPRMPAASPPADLSELWREIARHPDDRGVREVLADALVEAGDPRGEAFVLDLRGREGRPMRSAVRGRHDGRVSTLWRVHWHTWLGELAAMIGRRTCVIRDGMLDDIVIGNADTVRTDCNLDHRELGAVRAVRAGWICAEPFGRFVRALPAVRLVEVATPYQLDAVLPLPRLERLWIRMVPGRNGPIDPDAPIERLARSMSWWDERIAGTPLVQQFAGIAERAPQIIELAFDLSGDARTSANDLVDLLPSLWRQFPKLERILLTQGTLDRVTRLPVPELLARPGMQAIARFGPKSL